MQPPFCRQRTPGPSPSTDADCSCRGGLVVSVEFKARLPLSEQEMCCGYDDLAGPLPETRSVRSLLPPPAGHFASSPRVSSRACQRTRPAGKRAASARLGLFLLAPLSFSGLDWEGPKAGFALWCSGLRSSSTYRLSFLCGPDFFLSMHPSGDDGDSGSRQCNSTHRRSCRSSNCDPDVRLIPSHTPPYLPGTLST